MTLNEDVERLRKIPLFAKIEPSRLKLIAFTSRRIAFEPGEPLFRQGEPGDAAFIIIDGEAEVAVDTPDGAMTVATVGPNDIVGEIAILCDVPRTATVTAKTRLTAMRIAKELFFELVNQFPEIAIAIMRELAHRLEVTTRQLQEAVSRRRGT